jgi:hypothetical protein
VRVELSATMSSSSAGIRRIATIAAHMQPAEGAEEGGAEAAASKVVPAPQSTLSATDVFHGLFSSSPANVTRHGGDLVADVLEAHGVKFIFTLVGGHISPLLVSSKNRGIRIIDVRHEVNTVFAADAVGRLTGAFLVVVCVVGITVVVLSVVVVVVVIVAAATSLVRAAVNHSFVVFINCRPTRHDCCTCVVSGPHLLARPDLTRVNHSFVVFINCRPARHDCSTSVFRALSCSLVPI